jgi:hypothetical protein
MPVFNRSDRFHRWSYENFNRQNYPNKKLFVMRNNLSNEANTPERAEAVKFWKSKMTETPQVVYWEINAEEFPMGKFSLAAKRNLMNEKIVQDNYDCDFIATMDDDDIYVVDYLTVMQREFAQNPKLMLVKFRDFFGLHIVGIPPSSPWGNSPRARAAVVAALKQGQGFRDTGSDPYIPLLEVADSQNKWYLHSRGGATPMGFGFSFMYRAQIISKDGFEYGDEDYRLENKHSGEEDHLFKQVLEKYGKWRIKQLPLSKSWRLAIHMETGLNVSGITDRFRFPSESFIAVPRPLALLHVGLLEPLAELHPDRGIREWGKMLLQAQRAQARHHYSDLGLILNAYPNLALIKSFAEKWQSSSHWKNLNITNRFFVPTALDSERAREIDADYERTVEGLGAEQKTSSVFFPALQDLPLGYIPGTPGDSRHLDPRAPSDYYSAKETYQRYEHQTQRSLVVIPGSHRNLYNQLRSSMLYQSSAEGKVWPDFQGVKLKEALRYGSAASQETTQRRWESSLGAEQQQRAVQLDVRGACGENSSCMLVWNSALIHQGATSVNHSTWEKAIFAHDPALFKAGSEYLAPGLHTPPAFALSDEKAWRAHLERHGFVLFKQVLTDMQTVLAGLLSDIRAINPIFHGSSLDEVREVHLGMERRGLRYTLGYPQGEFAWRIRNDAKVRAVWQRLYAPTAGTFTGKQKNILEPDLIGSLDVPALSLNEDKAAVLEEWLHLDQNPVRPWSDRPEEMYPDGSKVMYQSFVYLFPSADKKINPLGGSTWNRMAAVICMVPAAYGRSSTALPHLLALAITGEASNHWPQTGVASWYGGYGSRNMPARRLTLAQFHHNLWRRLQPALNPNVYKTKNLPWLLSIVEKLGFTIDTAKYSPQSKLLSKAIELIQLGDGFAKEFSGPGLKSQQFYRLATQLSISELQRLVHPRVLRYIGETKVHLTHESVIFGDDPNSTK